jgi:hypothetical protein
VKEMFPVILAPWVVEKIVVTVGTYAGKKIVDKLMD